MPLVFGVIGIVLIISGVRGTVSGTNPNLVSLVKDDFTGQPNYFEWMAAIFIIGAIGYVKELAPISRGLMALVIIGLLFSNRGFFASLKQQVTATPSISLSDNSLSSNLNLGSSLSTPIISNL